MIVDCSVRKQILIYTVGGSIICCSVFGGQFDSICQTLKCIHPLITVVGLERIYSPVIIIIMLFQAPCTL